MAQPKARHFVGNLIGHALHMNGRQVNSVEAQERGKPVAKTRPLWSAKLLRPNVGQVTRGWTLCSKWHASTASTSSNEGWRMSQMDPNGLWPAGWLWWKSQTRYDRRYGILLPVTALSIQVHPGSEDAALPSMSLAFGVACCKFSSALLCD